MILILDTETTGLPKSMDAPYTDTENWPHMLSIAWKVYYTSGEPATWANLIAREREGVVNQAMHINGITPEIQAEVGKPIEYIMSSLRKSLERHGVRKIVAHNVQFDKGVILAEMERLGWHYDAEKIENMEWFCTKEDIGNLLNLPPTEAQRKYRPEIEYKQPRLDELYQFLFGKPVPGREESHGAEQDAAACAACYWELKKRGHI